MNKNNKLKFIFLELGYHLPFSIFGVTLGIIFVGLLTFISSVLGSESLTSKAADQLFHIFHPAHILFSAVTTTAMFWKHDRHILKAIIVGFLGSIFICGLSDMFFPLVGGLILGADMHIHICIIENPSLIIIFTAIGVLSGLMVKKNQDHSIKYSHSAHVFISSTSSLLYLIGFGLNNWMDSIASIFIITIMAVMIPCCLSDIVFPLTCAHKACNCKN